MNIKALRAFRHTLETGSVAEASQKMHLSPSAVGRLIVALEGTLRLTLFHRRGRRLVPTAEGRAFYREARRILENLEEVGRIADEIREGSLGRLRIVTMPRTVASLVAPSVARFMQEVPEVRLTLAIRRHEEAERWLAGREYDLGVGALPVFHPDVGTTSLLQSRVQAVLPRGHRLSERTSIQAEDLASETLIGLLPGVIQRTTDDLFGSVGLARSTACEVGSSSLACRLVADGAGVTIMDSLAAYEFGPDELVLRPIIPERWVSFGLLLSKDTQPEPHCQLLIGFLKETAKRLAASDPWVRLSEPDPS